MKFKFENLDSIRTIAFLSTFMAHAFYAESEAVLNSSSFQWAVQFREVFSFGVPVFFVLSGFLISYLMLKEQEEVGHFSVKNFYMRRILRIWPVFYLVLIIGFVLFPLLRMYVLHEPYLETANPLYYISYLSNFDQMANTSLPYGVGLGPTWSVSIEEQFYVLWPLLLLFFKKKRFVWAILFILISSMILTTGFQLSNKHTIYCMMYLSVGGLFAYFSFYHTKLIQKITSIHPVVFIALILLLFGCMYATTIGYGGFLLITLIASIIGYIIIYQCYSGRMSLKRIPFLETIGKYTYGLYLYHVICNFIIYTAFSDVLNIQESEFNVVFAKPVLSLVLSLGLSYISYHYFEKYFLGLKKRFNSAN